MFTSSERSGEHVGAIWSKIDREMEDSWSFQVFGYGGSRRGAEKINRGFLDRIFRKLIWRVGYLRGQEHQD